MHKSNKIIRIFTAAAVSLSLLSSCGSASGSVSMSTSAAARQIPAGQTAASRITRTDFLSLKASGESVYGTDDVTIDASGISSGYFMVRYTGDADLIKIQVTIPAGDVYTYTLIGNEYTAFPLSGGSGTYHIDIFEHAFDDMYAMLCSQDLDVSLSDEFLPFLYPNQYVWFTQDSSAMELGMELSDSSSDDLDYLTRVYHWVTENVEYDTEKAANISVHYVPDIDDTYSTKKGICFDYASLMSALLRSQGIPTKLEVGYSGTAYHAWISVYLDEIGWVDKIIEFDGSSWSLLDPTLAANNDTTSVGEYIGDGSNYTVKYHY